MINSTKRKLPKLFRYLVDLQCLSADEVYSTSDGFSATAPTIADILARRDITTVPNSLGDPLECRLFFDDWYLYAISDKVDCTYSLFKMREQEYDAKLGLNADGDTPGVTISFISLRPDVLVDCLQNPSTQNRKKLNEEINRVVAHKGQTHHKVLKEYFIRTESQGAYTISKKYTEYIATLAKEGYLPVPERYTADYRKHGTRGRVSRFIEENNRNAGKVICDHEKIYIFDPFHPTEPEQLAILATHAGNASFFSFAAEVQFHAKFLTWWSKIPIPIIGKSPYSCAIRADMSIGDAEFVGPTPYYRSDSRIVQNQYYCHKDNI